jgi:phenylalanyl-tRNA synthetase alpha chain
VLRRLGELSLAEKKAVGARANEVKVGLEAGLAEKERALRTARMASLAGDEALDVTLPGRTPPVGRLHPADYL